MFGYVSRTHPGCDLLHFVLIAHMISSGHPQVGGKGSFKRLPGVQGFFFFPMLFENFNSVSSMQSNSPSWSFFLYSVLNRLVMSIKLFSGSSFSSFPLSLPPLPSSWSCYAVLFHCSSSSNFLVLLPYPRTLSSQRLCISFMPSLWPHRWGLQHPFGLCAWAMDFMLPVFFLCSFFNFLRMRFVLSMCIRYL